MQSSWDKSYELKAVGLLAIGFGLVGLDRFIIAPLFPAIAEDLGLNYQDLGLISGVLALTWGLASLFAGRLTDRVGYRRVLVMSVILFSSLVAMSGLATGLTSLIVIRALMGFAEGGFVPASIVGTIDASKPSRIGLTVGIQQMAASLVGLGLGFISANRKSFHSQLLRLWGDRDQHRSPDARFGTGTPNSHSYRHRRRHRGNSWRCHRAGHRRWCGGSRGHRNHFLRMWHRSRAGLLITLFGIKEARTLDRTYLEY